MSKEVKKIGVIGAGQMGNGIAHVAAASGYQVILNDLNETAIQKGIATIDKNLSRGVTKGRMTEEEKQSVLANIKTSTDLESMADADFVIEAAVENIEIKKSIFKQLDSICSEGAILATNTSSISITEIAAVTKRPEAVIGMHFMNPVPVMKLVEIIRGLGTSDATTKQTHALSEAMGKIPVECRDFPGFVANRILMPMINEAVYTLYEGIATAEAIDSIMKLGMNHPMGPLTLADFIGLDTCLAILEVLHEGFGDPKYRPCPLLRKHVEAGWLGRKSGRGFYDYTPTTEPASA